MSKERILVTAALPYANGPVHVGHAIGAYIPADLYTRYHRLKGNDVLYISGTDEHGTPISVTAEREGISPKDVVDKYHEIIKNSFSKLGINFDNFSRTTRELHYRTSQDFFLEILKKGFIYKRTVERPYCPNCKRFLPDRFVKGICPYCGSKDERGDQCESCGKQLEPHELKSPYCIICRTTPVQKPTEHWFFRLSEFSERLKKWISENKHWPDNARNFSLAWISEGLQDRAITRDLDWGVPVPVENSREKVLYVWFDAPIGYISATKEWAENRRKPEEWKKYWIEDCKIVHFIGKDNIPFHAIIWPAMLMAHSSFNLPWQVSSNEYLTLEGKKMSTSRGWVLWLHDFLSEFEPDLLRYYLIRINPERHDADFSLREFHDKVNNELISNFGNFINRVLTFIEKKDSVIPEPTEFDELDNRMLEVIREAPEKVGRKIENFKFMEALMELMNIAHFGNEYFQKKEPWKNENGTTLYLCANLARTLAILSSPFLPFSAENIWKMLNLEGGVNEQDWNSAAELRVASGHKIKDVEPLYTKIEDKDIENFEKKYMKLNKKMETAVNYLEFSDFEKMDLRIGKIKSVEDHPKAEKLYILWVDIGTESRRVIAAIRGDYGKEDLIGRNVLLISNLKPKTIAGVKSEGMLLVAEGKDGKLVLLSPESDVNAGAKVK